MPFATRFIASTVKSVVFWLVLINVAIFSWTASLPETAQEDLYFLYGLSRIGLESGGVWQFFTYGFLHGNVWHLGVNMLALYCLGRPVEKMLGAWRFILLYLLTLIAGGIGQLVFAPDGLHLIGASGAVCGVILAFSTMYWERQVLVLLFFVLPIPLRARYLGWLVIGSSSLMVVLGFQPGIGHAAHLAGAIVGFLYARALGFGPHYMQKWKKQTTKN